MKETGLTYAEGTDDYKADIKRLIGIVEEFRRFDPQMELSQLLIYLLITVKPGLRVPELIPLTGLSRSALSRNILALSQTKHYQADHRSNGKPGLDLITTTTDPFNASATLAAPTRRGVGLAQKIASYFHKEAPDGA